MYELISPKYHRQPAMFKFFLLLASTNAPTIEKFSTFVFKALNTRQLSVSQSLDPFEFELPECSLLLLWVGGLTVK